MKAAIYLRVSSKDGERQDEANQEPDCARLCAARGWEPILFRERESGAKVRPEWRRLLEAARTGHVGAVVFWALDRTGRDSVQVCHDLRELARWGVHIASVKDSWVDQPPGPFRDLMLQIVAWFAEGERRRLIERTKAGLDRARALGVRLGRKPTVAIERLEAAAREVANGRPVATAARLAGIGRRTLRDYLAGNGPAKAAS